MIQTKNSNFLIPSKSIPVLAGLVLFASSSVSAAFSFVGVAAGDASTTGAILWTRGVDDSSPAAALVTVQVSTDLTFSSISVSSSELTNPARDYTIKFGVTGLSPSTVYYYRFVGPSSELSVIGRFKTAPDPAAAVPIHFAFSGDNDGLMRPYALASVFPAQNLDFYINLGDVIYENLSDLTKSGVHNGASWLNSPSVKLSNDSLSFNGVPRGLIPGGTPFATQAQLKADYEKKYRENFLPVNSGGQNSLQVLYSAQGNYTTWDNHELGNRKYIDGGARAGGSVGGANGNDMLTGRGVDARNNVGGNVGNVNDVNTSPTDYMNRSTGFLTLENVFLAYQPIADRGLVNAPTDPRSHGTELLYNAQQWGRNAIYINTDARSYRDLRLKTPTASADDTGSRADHPSRTYLGTTQFVWLKQTLLNAEQNGTLWKFVSVSDPIDEIGPIAGVLTSVTAAAMQPFSGNLAYGPVNADGGKAYLGGYRAERNALLKFIADNQIKNVVFLSTDDHQNRINEVLYSPSGRTGPGSVGFAQSDYVKVPYCFSIVCGPLGATGPDLFKNHDWASIQGAANLVADAETAAGVEPIGIKGYPGLHDVKRDQNGILVAEPTPQAADFYSPDTFNFDVLDVTADGRTLTVVSFGMSATAQNAGIEYPDGPQAHTILTFQVDAATRPDITFSGFVLDRRTNKMLQRVTVVNHGMAPISGPIYLALDSLSASTSLANSVGSTENALPTGSPYVKVSSESLAPGASVVVDLQFTRPLSGGIIYHARSVSGLLTP